MYPRAARAAESSNFVCSLKKYSQSESKAFERVRSVESLVMTKSVTVRGNLGPRESPNLTNEQKFYSITIIDNSAVWLQS